MAFDGASDRYLTCLPVEVLRQQAFVRTWPAPESSRPGSVWSHALFIDFVDLGEMRNLRRLLSLFRYPETGLQGPPLLEPYELPISLSGVPRASAEDGAPSELADDLLILWAAYGHEPPSIVRATDQATMEMSLIRLWEQQWPLLRRSFSRPSGDAFRLQAVTSYCALVPVAVVTSVALRPWLPGHHARNQPLA